MKEIERLAEVIKDNYGRTIEITSALSQAYATFASFGEDRNPDALMMFGTGDPNSGQAVTNHYRLFTDYLHNISGNGPHARWVINAAILSIFEYWEHVARKELARLLECDRDQVLRPVWGDLRHLRNACAHKDNKLLGSLDVFDFFEPGETVSLSVSQFELIILSLLADCEELTVLIYGSRQTFPLHMYFH